MKKVFFGSLIFYGLSLIITKILLINGFIGHDLRAGLSLHIFVGLMAVNILYLFISNLFDKKSKNYKKSVFMTVWSCWIAVAAINWFFIQNWILATGIQFISFVSFNVLFITINRREIFGKYKTSF